MISDSVIQMIQILSGGAVIGIVTLIINQFNKRHEIHNKEIDDRIVAWQKIANENKERLAQMEKRLGKCEKYTRDSHIYITNLEQLFIRTNPDVELPPRPWSGCDDCDSE